MWHNPFFVKINASLMEKSNQKCGLRLSFSLKLPKVNIHPIGENSPYLVTLTRRHWGRGREVRETTFNVLCSLYGSNRAKPTEATRAAKHWPFSKRDIN
jgi:hypothetical protein